MSYKEKFKLAYENQNDRLIQKTENYKSKGLPSNPLNLLVNTSNNMEMLAVGEYIFNQDKRALVDYYYNVAKIYLVAMKYYDENPDSKNAGIVSMLSLSKLYDALVSESDELIKEFAELMGGRGDIDKANTNDFTLHYGYALKYLTLGDFDSAKEHVSFIAGSERKVFADCMTAIIERDTEKANEGLVNVIKWLKRNGNQNTHHDLVSKVAVGLAKLCIRNGLKVNINDELAPSDMINYRKDDYTLFDIAKLDEELTA